MHIISHRGIWSRRAEANTKIAFERSFNAGFGVELDVRDRAGEVVVSHDLPGASAMPFKEFLKLYTAKGAPLVLAINIKSDGIECLLYKLLKRFSVKNSFVFDMSVISAYTITMRYKKLAFAARHSDIEKKPIFYKEAKWVWMDELGRRWIENKFVERHVRSGKKVCIVSPELHNRSYKKAWTKYKMLSKKTGKSVYICTDFPEDAKKFFNGR